MPVTHDSVVILPNAARTVAANYDFENQGHKGIHLIIDATAISATPSVTFTIQGKDPASGKFYTILASAAIVGVGTTVLRVYPGLDETANTDENDVLPEFWRLAVTVADADALTYSVGAHLLK